MDEILKIAPRGNHVGFEPIPEYFEFLQQKYSSYPRVTILQNALNESPEIFLFGEPDLHKETREPGFAARYNAMHRAWGNQETKSTFCPPVLPFDGTSEDYLKRLSESYTWVGSKIAIAPRNETEWFTQLKTFQCNRFYTAHYIFVFRTPLAVIRSTHNLQAWTGSAPHPVGSLLLNYLDTMTFFIWAFRNLKYARAVFHEDIDEQEMAKLGSWLNVDLSNAAAYYDKSRMKEYQNDNLNASERDLVAEVTQLYSEFREGVRAGLAQPQIEQNDTNLSPGHYKKLGYLNRRADMIRQKC